MLLQVLLLLTATSVACGAVAETVQLVDIRNETDARFALPLNAAAGLLNRAAASVYVVSTDDDDAWRQLLLSNVTLVPTPALDIINASVYRFGVIVYDDNVTGPYLDELALDVLPAVVSLAGIWDAVPVGASLLPLFPSARIVFNAVGAWVTANESVAFAAAAGLNVTTSLAFQQPPLIAAGQLVDWLVSARIFTLYLNNSCLPGTSDHTLLAGIVAAAPWLRPVRVYGYNSLDPVFGGDVFEAETDCINVMGQVASAGSHNLAFWSHVHPVNTSAPRGSADGPLLQASRPRVPYDGTKTFVALVYGDMDNIDFVQTFGREHMQERAARCATNASSCFPLTWTLSPNLLRLAPHIARWYYSTARAAMPDAPDAFIMPPSGTLYSYPGQMPADVRAAYACAQDGDASAMDTGGSVHWEWVLTWADAWDGYFPLFTTPASCANVTLRGPRTRSFFLNNVPWVIPILDMLLANQTFRVVGNASDSDNAVVAFRPAFNWQLDGPSGGLPYNASVIAALISALPPGTITYVYVIQNTDLGALFDMVAQLQSHVTLVAYDQLRDLALQQAAAAAAIGETSNERSP